ncbi:MAG TPA: DoxX family protein [Polyangiaceae bacterium]|nr:DoxX family protein [Polyangiaceae bacterium]
MFLGVKMSNITAKFSTAARWALGIIFFVFGLNGFLHFLPQPPMAGPAADFAGALAATGYMFPLIKGTEVLVSLLLLSNRFVPLALTLLAPISINILLFHLVLAPALGLPLFIIGAQLFLAWSHREAYRGVLSAHSVPHIEPSAEPRARVQHA